MPVQFDMLMPGLLAFAVLLVAVMAFYLVRARSRLSTARRRQGLVSGVMIDYFRKTGVEVAVACVDLRGTGRFTAFVESEPMKQFRLSHIIEIALRDHVHKTCGLELDRVFWRFPIKVAPRESAKEETRIEGADDYINEGLVHYKDLPKQEATEIPWEKFEEAAIQEASQETKPAKAPK